VQIFIHKNENVKSSIQNHKSKMLKLSRPLRLLFALVPDNTDNHFRVGLGRRNLPQAIDRLEKFL